MNPEINLIIIDFCLDLLYHNIRKEAVKTTDPTDDGRRQLDASVGGFWFYGYGHTQPFTVQRNCDFHNIRSSPFNNLTMRITSLTVEM